MASATRATAERVIDDDCDVSGLSIDEEADTTLSLTSAGSAADSGGLMRRADALDLSAFSTASSAAVLGGAECGSTAKSSFTCSRQKSRAGAEPTDSVRSKAITHLLFAIN